MDSIASDVPAGVQQVIDYLADLVEPAPDVLRDTVLQLVETVQEPMRSLLTERLARPLAP